MALVIDDKVRPLCSFRMAPPKYVEMLYAYIATPLDRNFLIFMHVARLQTKRAISNAKHVIGLKLGGRLALGYSLSNILQA